MAAGKRLDHRTGCAGSQGKPFYSHVFAGFCGLWTLSYEIPEDSSPILNGGGRGLGEGRGLGRKNRDREEMGTAMGDQPESRVCPSMCECSLEADTEAVRHGHWLDRATG